MSKSQGHPFNCYVAQCPIHAFATLYKIHSALRATGFRKDDHVNIQKGVCGVELMVREQTIDAEKT